MAGDPPPVAPGHTGGAPVPLRRLLEAAGIPPGDDVPPNGPMVADVAMSDAAVSPGTLFVAIRGRRHDGHDWAAEAVRRGAVAVIAERPLDLPVPVVVVPSGRAVVGPLAAAVHGNPSEAMTVVGVTGTNGKTTTVHLLAAIAEAAGVPPATIGTLTGARTTPEAPDLQRRLARARAAGVGMVAMEVSSHALDQHRTDGTVFAAAVFTNLSPEHLDYHGTMERYFAAKARLFDPAVSRRAVVNLDDPWGRRLARRRPDVVGYRPSDAGDISLGLDGTRLRWGPHRLRTRLLGRVNVPNVVAAAATARALGLPPGAIEAGVAAAPPVPGRMEPVSGGQPFGVLVDYAHTPEALRRVLADARELAAPDGRVLVVFGAGGDRDTAKRPAMGAAATAGADVAWLTTDNPRTEDPGRIAAEVAAGADPSRLRCEPDRAAAIAAALAAARPGDVVVIAGKGHETTMEIGGRRIPFDDREVAARILEDLS